MIRAALISPLLLAACDTSVASDTPVAEPEYRGVETNLLDGDLVQFNVSMINPRAKSDLDDYAECAAAQYTLIRGYGFARHLRTNVHEEGGVWTADAVYTISPSLPRGLLTVDAEVAVANCAENGIPTV
ncbi:hypothetical protein [Falsiphaeobacter marinintestinus]|uniref:hypothetical protein n=1 Tax=Falsiphaeobacter marinintestinus TaxID=1492905 RepID=UPI0011B68CE6|nr:hypothetical protein [Phaeobacter marinintestinus]